MGREGASGGGRGGGGVGTLFMRMLLSSHVSSASTMLTVSLPRLPLIRTVSPRKSCSSVILAIESATTELSSLVASSTTRRFGERFFVGPSL